MEHCNETYPDDPFPCISESGYDTSGPDMSLRLQSSCEHDIEEHDRFQGIK